MGELAIRRNRGSAVTGCRGMDKAEKAEKTESGSPVRKPAAGFTVSESLRQRLTKSSQAESQYRESRRTLQVGEVVLSKVQDCLDRIADLARESAGGGEPDRAGLQAELERLQAEIDRMVGSASIDGVQLFLDGDVELDGGTEALLYAIMDGAAGGQKGELPKWLTQGMAQEGLTPEQILSELGLDKDASASDILRAIAGRPLESDPVAGRLAALYLGAVIAGSTTGPLDLDAALDGLRQLLEKVAGGAAPDEAIEALTAGEFTSFSDFQSRFTGGTAPGLDTFLVNLLLSGGDNPLLSGSPLLNLLAGAGGMDLDLLMALLNTTQTPASTAETGAPSPLPAPLPPDGGADGAAGGTAGAAGDAPASAPPAVRQIRSALAEGEDLPGVSLNAGTGALTVDSAADVTIRGTGQEPQAVTITGTGTVTLRNMQVSVLTIAAGARVLSAGGTALAEVELREGASLTLGGSGLIRIGVLRAGASSAIRLLDGAAVLVADRDGGAPAALTVPVVLEGPASLAAQAANVRDAGGNRLEPFDVLWKALIPGWNSITSLAVDGRQARMALLGGNIPDPVRLWLAKGDPSHGYPAHELVLRGRDESGRLRTRYAYLRWSQHAGAFQELSMYPNPFTVTGGEPGRDWAYDEASHTLHILTPQVTAISGGAGTDANQAPFSGRIALADSIGAMELTLGGVVCRVSSGRAFSLGRANDVTLLLQRGSSNHFESGAGCAGISLGDGTSLRIDSPGLRGGDAAGTLTATGGAGGAGIGRDSGSGRDRTSQILIRGGVITATGTGGGAGIGAGKHGYMGPVTIAGGVVTSTGGTGGGAGIGGALGAPAGDIRIRGGTVTASAANHAAAIGAGILGDSGDIRIDGTARIAKALGGDPGADIGACLFGGCGDVFISRGADIGSARLWARPGISLQMGEDAVTLPQFRLSSRALQLNRLCVSTREEARAARITIDADRRWVSQIQTAYSALYNRLEQSFGGIPGAGEKAPVRDAASASTLLEDTRQSILLQSSQAMSTHSRRDAGDVRQLLR